MTMNRAKAYRLVRTIWLGAWILVLVSTLCQLNIDDDDLGLVILLLLLGFPSSWLVGLGFSPILRLLEDRYGIVIYGTKWYGMGHGALAVLYVLVVWASLGGAGYVQWFLLLPRILKWVKRVDGDQGDGNSG
jgi:hypothetical protein